MSLDREQACEMTVEEDLGPACGECRRCCDALRARVEELEEPQVGIVRCPHCDEEHDVQLSRGRTNDPNRTDQSGDGGQ